MTYRILFVDDEAGVRELAVYNLTHAGYKVDQASHGKEALARFNADIHDLVISDLRMPEMTGLELIKALHQRAPELPIILITAFGSIETAVDAMRLGGADFILKPFGREQLLFVVQRALATQTLKAENKALKRQLQGVERPIISASPAMQTVLNRADKVALTNATVLVTGESGTGKELIARRIHARSHRAKGPFIALNCAAVSESLVEAELFGHDKGAFTGAVRARSGKFRQAEAGTLFLDEIAELSLSAQSKLLRVLQEGEIDPVGSDLAVKVDVRVVAATHRDLQVHVEKGLFREDLFFRLNVIDLVIPPLRHRKEDIPSLVNAFVKKFSPGNPLTINNDLFTLLKNNNWQGNVRELMNLCERMVIFSEGEELNLNDLPDAYQREHISLEDNPPNPKKNVSPPTLLGDTWQMPEQGFSLLDMESNIIHKTLQKHDGNMSESARYLKIPRHVLLYRIEKYGIKR